MSSNPLTKKQQFVANGIFYAELNEFLQAELGVEGYSGVEVHNSVKKTRIVIRATRTQEVVGENHLRIHQLTAIIKKRFPAFREKELEVNADKVQNRALSAIFQAEAVKFKLNQGLNIRRAAYSVLRFAMENQAKGVEVIVSGKLSGARAKSMKFRDGFMVKSGDSVNHYTDYAVRHIQLKQGILGIKVKIQLPHDPQGRNGGVKVLPADVITVKEPKDE